VAALKGAGFAASKPGDVASQVSAFQRAHGLLETGRLDDETRAKLAEKGLLAGDGAAAKAKPGETSAKLDAGPAPAKAWGDFAGPRARPEARAPQGGAARPVGERQHVVAQDQAKARAELAREAPKDMRSLLETLGGLGFSSGGRGKERLEGALRSFQQTAGLPVTAKLDAATVRELVQRGALPEGSEAAALKASLGDPAATLGRDEARPASARGQPGEGQGAQRGDPRASQGRGERGEGAPAAGQGGAGVLGGANVDGGFVAKGDPGGVQEHDTNAPAGDEDFADARRGHANVDDESEDDEGHWEVPPLSAQLRAALEELVRDDDEGGAATYSWDVTFYKPGVFGRRQPAEALWHLVVDRASAFDDVWREAHGFITARMSEAEPTAFPLVFEDFVLALRRARVRGVSPRPRG
jgi:peptidoglycan hydrolase-like protein with peptidoglycan-binding domain